MMEIDEARVCMKPQKELIYNKLLPYAEYLDDESYEMFRDIKGNIGLCVAMREMIPGCALWTARLRKYIKLYGLRFSKQDHLHLIYIYYELVTIPNLEPYLISKFSQLLITLLKKKELLSPSELMLPWRPLYDLCERILSNSRSAIGMDRYFSGLELILDSLVHASRYYFPVSATEEMLDEWMPKLCPFDSHRIAYTIGTMEWFLPIALPPALSEKGYKLWFDEMMNLWELCNNAPNWETDILWLMARLARCNIGYIDWEPYIPLMFTRFLRSFHLPVSYKQMQSSKNHKLDASAIALWIVSVLGGGSSAQKCLEKFMMALESYFHPANYGRWLLKLSEFLSKLPLYFVQRLNVERYRVLTWENPIPDTHKLTEEDITKFVESVRSVAMKAMFSKMGLEVGQAMQHLATLRPELVIPEIVESVYSNLETVVHPHKFQASLHCLIAVIRPMIEDGKHGFKEGRTHVIPILLSVLPGIDPNDIRKCFVVFHFISTVATMVPIVDCSKASEYYNNLTEEEETVCLATARFEDFVLQFLDRCFLIVESSVLESTRLERDADKRSRMENMAESALASTCIAVLTQTSPQIFKVALKKLHSYVMGRILETKVAGQFLATMCRSFAKVNADDTLRLFLPRLCENILSLTAADDVLQEEILDNELLYNLLLISEIVDCPGTSLLPHVPILKEVLSRTLHLSCREGFVAAAKLLNLLLNSLTATVPIEFRSVPRDYGGDLKDYLPIRDWGKAGNVHDLNLKWYVPRRNEIDAVQSIISMFLPQEINRIEAFIENENTMSSDQLQCSLGIISALLGCKPLLPVWNEEPEKLKSSWLPQSPFTSYKPPQMLYVTMPDGSNVRKNLVQLMHRLQEKLLQCKEDDTKSFFTLINIWESLLLNLEDKNTIDARWKRFRLVKKILENKLVGQKRHLRALLIDRALLQHDILSERRTLSLTSTHRQIMCDLLTLSISRYSEVRIRAQSKLFMAVENFPYSYLVLIPTLVECLRSGDAHDQFKGALYVLLGPKQGPIITCSDWISLRSLWPALVEAKPSEKISVIRLLENVVDVVHRRFATITIDVKIPFSCIETARKLWEFAPYPSFETASDVQIAKGLRQRELKNKDNFQEYEWLLKYLTNCIEVGNLHWRFHSMALSFLRDLVHPYVAYPPETVKCFLNTLIDDSLELRKIAIRCIVFVLKHQKQTHEKICVDPYSLLNLKRPKKVFPGDRPDNQWIQYKSSNIPSSAEDWNKTQYAHQVYHGYYSWPKEVQLYAPSNDPPPLMVHANLTDGEKEVYSFFSLPSNIDKLMDFFTLEEKKGKDKFNGYRFLFFKSLFRNGGYEMFGFFIEHLQKLVHSKQESHQRCASEIIAGAIRGAKHWPYDMVKSMWETLTPAIRHAILNMTEETFTDWGVCFATASENRDPRRNHWLFEVLLEEPPAHESSFNECGRLYAIQGALNQQLWRMVEVLNVWLEKLRPQFSHRFQNVRERMGSVMSNIFEADVTFPGGNGPQSPRIEPFIRSLIPDLSVLYKVSSEAIEGNPKVERKSVMSCMGDMVLNTTDVSDEERDTAVRLLKTVCRWLTASVSRSQFGVVPIYYELLPLICLMESYEADEELARSCTYALVAIGQTLHVPRCIPVALHVMKKVSQSPSWQARATCLEFLQVFVFNNMSVILSKQEWTIEVQSIVLRLMEDDWLDVREKSSQVLGGLVHIGFIEDSLKLLEFFKTKAATKISKSKTREDSLAVKLRHTGVLGLSAFINAYPYDVPEFIPDLFVVLGQHLNDPQPIPSTIRKTLGEFKRTHHDNWGEHSLKFTEAQLTVLGDITIPPSYYA